MLLSITEREMRNEISGYRKCRSVVKVDSCSECRANLVSGFQQHQDMENVGTKANYKVPGHVEFHIDDHRLAGHETCLGYLTA